MNLYSSVDVICRSCLTSGPEGSARAFVQAPPLSIVLCSDRLTAAEIPEVIVHELTHVYDIASKKLDFAACDDLAYSEVRAARDAECTTLARNGSAVLSACKRAGGTARNAEMRAASAAAGGTGGGGLPPPLFSRAGAERAARRVCDSAYRNCAAEKAKFATTILHPDGGECVKRVFEKAYGDYEPEREGSPEKSK